MKKILLPLLLITLAGGSVAQPLFTMGKVAVTKDEFVRAFNKNPSPGVDRKKALKDYLDLYINFRLKVQAAYDAGLDKDTNQQNELQNFKNQLAENIINNEANVKELVKQAFERSQKEIRLQQVFIEVPSSGDTIDAYRKIDSAYKQLQEGKDFGAVVQEFSSDEATRQSKGDLGFITVFTLPYTVENEVYRLKPNSFSQPFRSKAGYHVFKNASERKSIGSRRVAQILVAIPPNATAEDRTAASRKADSVYNLLTKGSEFGALASVVSNDLSTSNNRGELPELTVGMFDADFEKEAFSLKNNGDISRPFQSAYGYHILKLLEARPAPTDLNDPVTFSGLQEKVKKDNRLELSKKELIQKKLAVIKYKPVITKPDDLYSFTDSVMIKRNAVSVKGIDENTTLFSFASQNVKAGDWLKFVKNSGNISYPVNKARYKELYQEYLTASADQYYRSNLDAYNSDYVKQVKEFKEANLLFGVMEKNVWGKANSDTAALLQYYNSHKSKYIWPPSSDAIIVTCDNENLAQDLWQRLRDNPTDWRQITSSNDTNISADSGRFELSQLPVRERSNFTPGLITAVVKNESQGTYSFNYLIKVYNQPEQRSFEDARGMVISDYQAVLEDSWLKELKKKYPVVVNQQVFQSIR